MNTQHYKEWRDRIESAFAEMSPLEGSKELHISPSGQFSLEISAYTSDQHTWEYSRGVVRRTSDLTVVADVKRNYGSFWHAWVPHMNGNEYLLCGEDYQGYNVVELQSGRNHVCFPEEAFSGGGFCWAAVHPSLGGLTLAVDGCYWACPYDLVFFDFSNPMEVPLLELARIGDFEDTIGWKSPTAFEYLCSEESGKKHRIWERGHARAEP